MFPVSTIQRRYVNVLADSQPQNVKENIRKYCLVFRTFKGSALFSYIFPDFQNDPDRKYLQAIIW